MEKKRFRPSEQQRPKVQEQHAAFRQELRRIRLEQLTFVGAVNGPRFVEFVRDTLCPRLYPGDVVVLDNLRAHHVPAVRELVEKVGLDYSFFPRTPPTSARLSPVGVS